MDDDKKPYILFINWENKLPREFFDLAMTFSVWGISLIPVNPNELSEFAGRKKQFCLSIQSNFTARKKALLYKKSHIDFLIHSRRIVLWDFSSFDEFEGFGGAKRWGHYKYFSLPIPKIDLASIVYYDLAKSLTEVNQWPGGRRAKLPLDAEKK